MLDIILLHEVNQQSIICPHDYNTILLLYIITKCISVKYFCHVLRTRNMRTDKPVKVPPSPLPVAQRLYQEVPQLD